MYRDEEFEVKINEELQKAASELIEYVPTLEEITSSVKESREREEFLLMSLIKSYDIWVR